MGLSLQLPLSDQLHPSIYLLPVCEVARRIVVRTVQIVVCAVQIVVHKDAVSIQKSDRHSLWTHHQCLIGQGTRIGVYCAAAQRCWQI